MRERREGVEGGDMTRRGMDEGKEKREEGAERKEDRKQKRGGQGGD